MPFDLPQGWQWARLGAVLPFQIGKTPPSKDPRYWGDQGYYWVSISDMTQFGEIRDTARRITQHGADVFGYEPLPPGTLLMSFKLTIGKVSILRVPAYHNEAIASFLPLGGMDIDFLKYALPAISQTGASKDALMGQTLNTSSLTELVIGVPPVAEQRRIVARVDELMRLCDALEAKGRLAAEQHARLLGALLDTLTDSSTPEELAANWQRVADHFDLLLDRPEAVDVLEQTILQLAVRGLLVPQDPSDEPANILLDKIIDDRQRLAADGKLSRRPEHSSPLESSTPFEIPQGWLWVRFGGYVHELCTGPFGSVIHKEDYVSGGVPLINPSHMIGGRIQCDLNVAVAPGMAAQLSAYQLSPGDVLMARRGEVGRYALVTEEEAGWLCGTGSFFVKLAEFCNRDFFGLMLEDPRFRAYLLGESVGATMTNLNQRILLHAPLAIPPLAEQARIVARVTELRRLCADLRQRLAASQAIQSHLAEALVQATIA